MALPKCISVGRQTAGRYFDTEGRLLVLFSDRDMYSGEYPLDDCELAFSSIGRTSLSARDPSMCHSRWRIPSGETFTFEIESIQREPSGAVHRAAFRMTV